MRFFDRLLYTATAFRRAILRNLDLIALLLLMVAICNFGLLTSDTPISRDTLNALDESWELDLVYKASHGIWSGRDFAFTYGPLWQYLASLLPRAGGMSTGAVFKFLYLFSYWASFVFAFLTGRLLLPAVEPWRRAVFLIALVVFWLPPDARSALALFCFAAYIRLVLSLPMEPTRLWWRGFCAAGLIAISFLMAGDSGALSGAGFAAVVSAGLILNWRHQARQLIHFALASMVCMLFWILAVNTWAGGPLHFQFWIWSAQIIAAYRWLMASTMAREAALRLVSTIVMCAAIFIGAWFARDPKSDRITMRPLFLLAGALFSGIALQKGVVRSGWGHLGQCMLPAIALSGAILVGYRSAVRAYISEFTLLAAVGLTVFFSGPANLFGVEGVVNRVTWTPPPYPACPPDTYYLDQACFPRREYATFGAASEYIRTHSNPQGSIVVYPYENIFGLLSRRRVSSGVLQNYAIGGDDLTDLQISTIERDRPALGVYCSDDVVSWPVDGISNFQRTAPVWLYLQSHYVTEVEPATGVAILRRDESRPAKSQRTLHELWRASASSDSAYAKIDPAQWARFPTDFLRLKIRTDYSPLWRILKPSAVFAVLQLADGSSKMARLAAEPDHLDEIWIYPWSEANLHNYFQPDPSRWRPAGPHLPAVTSVELRAEPLDRLSVSPRFIGIESIDGVELGQRCVTQSGKGCSKGTL